MSPVFGSRATSVHLWNGSPLWYGEGLPGTPSVNSTLPSRVH